MYFIAQIMKSGFEEFNYLITSTIPAIAIQKTMILLITLI